MSVPDSASRHQVRNKNHRWVWTHESSFHNRRLEMWKSVTEKVSGLPRRNQAGWVFCERQQAKFPDLTTHFAAGVSAEHAVGEIQQPNLASLAVVNVKSSGAVVVRCHHE